MFQGRWPNILTVDAKHRLTLPAPFRPAEGLDGSSEVTTYMVGVLNDSCLYLHTRAQHERFLERIYRKLGDSRESRRHKTVILSRFVPVTSDASGRITIPGFLLKGAGINKEVLLISQKSRVEIWAKEVFQELQVDEGLPPAVEEALEEVFAEEEREMRESRRGESPAGEGETRSGAPGDGGGGGAR